MGLIAWLPLNNEKLVDYAGNKPSTSLSLPTFNTDIGKVGGSYFFSNHNIKIDNLYTSESMSFAIWIRFNELKNCHIIDYRTSGDLGYQPIYYNITQGIQVWSSTSPVGGYIATGALSANVWYHIAVVINEGKGTLYLNGSRIKAVELGSQNRAVQLCLGSRYNGANPFNGYINDVRVYNHALSLLEIKELARAKVLHYTFDNDVIESTTNYLTYPTPTKTASPAWEASLHPNAIEVAGWTNGYNGSVSEPKKGYHAMWNEIEGIPTIVFNNLNSKHGLQNRWLGVNGGITEEVRKTLPGKTVTLSYEAKSSAPNMQAGCGLYYALTGSTTANFYDQNDGTNTAKYQNTTLDWKKYSITFTVRTTLNTSENARIFVYGYGGAEGVTYVRNIQMEINDHVTTYTPSYRSGLISNETGLTTGEVITDMSVSSNSRIGSRSGLFNGKTSCVDVPFIKKDLFTSDYTLSLWVYPLDDGRAVYFGDYQMDNSSNINFERKAGGVLRYYHAANPDKTFNGADAPANTWTMLTIVYSSTDKTMTVYKNGQYADSFSHTATLEKAQGSAMRIGRDSRSATSATSSSSTPLYGNINDFRFYASCLTANEIYDLYITGAKATKTGQVISSSFIENEGQIVPTKKQTIKVNNVVETSGEISFMKNGTLQAKQIVED